VIATFGAGSAGALAATAPFWAQVTLGESALTAAGMIATINALGNLGGFAGPALLGHLQQGEWKLCDRDADLQVLR